MKTKLLLFFFLVLVANSQVSLCLAQNSFNNIYFNNAGLASAFYAEGDSLFYSVVTEVIDTPTFTFPHARVRKFDRDGNVLDSIRIFEQGFTLLPKQRGINRISESRLILILEKRGPSNALNNKFYLLDNNLSKIDSLEYTRQDTTSDGYAYIDILVEDSTFMLLAIERYDSSTQIRLVISRFDFDLNLLSEYFIDDVRNHVGNYVPKKIIKIKNNYYISGYAWYPGQFEEGILVKMDNDGNKIFDKRYRYLGYNVSHSITKHHNADTLIMTQSVLTDEINNDYKLRLMYLDTNGNILTDNVFDHKRHLLKIEDIVKTHDGGYLITGVFFLYGWTNYILKVNSKLEQEFMRYYTYEPKAKDQFQNYIRATYSIHEWADSSITLTGLYLDMLTPQDPNFKRRGFLWVLSVGKDGCLSPSDCGAVWMNVDEIEGLAANTWSVYPNPAAQHATLRYNGIAKPLKITYQLIDNTGRTVASGSAPLEQFTEGLRLEVGHLSPGLYFIMAQDDNGQNLFHEKLIINP